MTISGIHHITLVSSDARRTADFYTGVLGLRLVKKTVNFDDPQAYHLYFGNQTGDPGTVVTFFEWPNAPKGRPGIGGTHHVALTVSDENALLKWKRRLTDLGLKVIGPLDRNYFRSIYFRDPDGVILEIATRGPGWTVDEPAESIGTQLRLPPENMTLRNRDEDAIRAMIWPEPVDGISPDMALQQGIHHISAISSDIHRTHDFYTGLLGMRLLKQTVNFDDPTSAHWYWGTGDGKPGTLITYFERIPGKENLVRMGTGQTHHVALAVPDEESQLVWREKLLSAGIPVSPVMDRVYFKSIYTRDPDGQIVELATFGPGFTIDEPVERLGQGLMLPTWLEQYRSTIETNLEPVGEAEGQR